jgi:hypothetical protein
LLLIVMAIKKMKTFTTTVVYCITISDTYGLNIQGICHPFGHVARDILKFRTFCSLNILRLGTFLICDVL